MSLIFLSFLAGILTVLAPCAFMLLPVIIGGSVGGNGRWRPYVITASLVTSLFLFTVVLKASSLLIDIDPVTLNYISGVIIVLLGLISLFPSTWDKVSAKFGLSSKSDKLLEGAGEKEGFLGMILTGAALGPVFSACSPTYVFILTTVFRENIQIGLINIFAYILGLSMIMLLVGLLGQRFVKKLKWAVNPKGIFKKTVAVVFIIVGFAIFFGLDKKIQAQFVEFSPVGQFEQSLLKKTQVNEKSQIETDNSKLLNVKNPFQAAEISGVNDWINSNGETIAANKGKVILIDFWTYSCVNCLRSAPYINDWYSAYKDQGFVVIGLHAPEFAFEKRKENVQKAVTETYKTEYPVGLDNDFKTWDAYKNLSWPSKYLIDAEGKVRYTHSGEGEYINTEKAIRALLEEKGTKLNSNIVTSQEMDKVPTSALETRETYLGWSRSEKFTNSRELKANETAAYTAEGDPQSNYWNLNGSWTINNENIISTQDTNTLKIKFSAKELYLVTGEGNGQNIQVKLNGQPIQAVSSAGVDIDNTSNLKVVEGRLYKVVKFNEFKTDQVLELTVPKGVQLNAFTFGS